MFPLQSTFRSGAGASAWWDWMSPVDKTILVYQTQWVTLVQYFQQNCKKLLLAKNISTFAVKPDGTCWSGSASEIPAALMADKHTSADIPIDGVWGPDSSDLLVAILCLTSDTNAAKLAQADAANKIVSKETMRFVIWLTFMVPPEAVNFAAPTGQDKVTKQVRDNGTGIVIPNDAVMPRWGDSPAPDSRDRDWFSVTPFGVALPNPPSLGAGTRAWPAQPAGVTPTGSNPSQPGAQGSTPGTQSIGALGLGLIALGIGLATGAIGGDGGSRSLPAPREKEGPSLGFVDEPTRAALPAPRLQIPSMEERMVAREQRAMYNPGPLRKTVVHTRPSEPKLGPARARPVSHITAHVDLATGHAQATSSRDVVVDVSSLRPRVTEVVLGPARPRHGAKKGRRGGHLTDGAFTRAMNAGKAAKRARGGKKKGHAAAPKKTHHARPHDPARDVRRAEAYGRKLGRVGRVPNLTTMRRMGFTPHMETIAERVAHEVDEHRTHEALHGAQRESRGEERARVYGEKSARLGHMPDADKMRAQKFSWDEIAYAQGAAQEILHQHRATG